MTKPQNKSRARSTKKRKLDPRNRRKLVVFATLFSVLGLTTLLLKTISPTPLTPGPVASLYAMDAPASLEADIFDAPALSAPRELRHWKYIYVHQTRTAGGDALSLARGNEGIGDHFLIGNGEGCGDGEIEVSQRWSQQLSALPPTDHGKIDPACISICLVGDFDHTAPSATQMRRLNQLVQTLQGKCHIPATSVIVFGDQSPEAANTPASAGRYFPISAFRDALPPLALAE